MGTHLLFSIAVISITIFLNWYWAKKTIRKKGSYNWLIFFCNLAVFIGLKFYYGSLGLEFSLLMLAMYWLIQRKVKEHNPDRFILEEMPYDPDIEMDKHWQQTLNFTKMQSEENSKRQQYNSWYVKYLGYMMALLILILIISAVL